MSVKAVIPWKPANPKTRLSNCMGREEREVFARCMLEDVIEVIVSAGCAPFLLSTHEFAYPDCPLVIDTRDLNAALNSYLEKNKEPLLIIMADLPLAGREGIIQLITSDTDISIVPGRGGGTNALFINPGNKFRVNYYGSSFLKHIEAAKNAGLSIKIIDSFLLHTDIDEEEDLVELFIHGNGKSKEFLKNRGFTLNSEHGRVGLRRT